MPVLLGLLNVWYTDFLGAQTHAVLPYSQYLHRFPAYLQQLTMESNGKSVTVDGTPVTYPTGEIFWGEPGTNGQHAFYQLIHQGTRLIPADFIALQPAQPRPRRHARPVHVELLRADRRAGLRPHRRSRSRRRAPPADVVPHRVMPGNHPTTSIIAPKLTPSTLGQLIALYEHIVFTEGAIWDINPFDQWGVELGKVMANQLAPKLTGAGAGPERRGLVHRRADPPLPRPARPGLTRYAGGGPPVGSPRRVSRAAGRRGRRGAGRAPGRRPGPGGPARPRPRRGRR